jgi:hypothetical protein
MDRKSDDLMNLGRFAEAIISYDRVLAIRPGDTGSLFAREGASSSSGSSGRPSEA